MTRRVRSLLALLALTAAFSVAACADTTAPQATPEAAMKCDQSNPWTCG
jgi:hypothetical protein